MPPSAPGPGVPITAVPWPASSATTPRTRSSESRSVPSASTTPEPSCGTPTCPGCGSAPRSSSIDRWPGPPASATSELRKLARLSYIKVVEFQRRGLVHLHVVVRADGAAGPAEPPPPWLGSAVLARAVEGAVASSVVAVPGVPDSALRRARWGTQVDVRVLDPGREGDSGGVAAYVAKYATKTADGSGSLAHPIRSRRRARATRA